MSVVGSWFRLSRASRSKGPLESLGACGRIWPKVEVKFKFHSLTPDEQLDIGKALGLLERLPWGILNRGDLPEAPALEDREYLDPPWSPALKSEAHSKGIPKHENLG